MPKINQEEYELLKSLDDKWKWIVRDKGAKRVDIYDELPRKSYFKDWWLVDDWCSKRKKLQSNLFQFIQWEDEEPYEIAELIREYENSAEHISHVVRNKVEALANAWGEVFKTPYESEEKEMMNINEIRKAASELIVKSEFNQEGQSDYSGEDEAFNLGVVAVINLLNKYQEPETTIHDAHDKLREVSPLNDELFDYYWNVINDGAIDETKSLDNYEVLSPEWIDENAKSFQWHESMVPVSKLQNLLVPKEHLGIYQMLEKVQIPQFVADFIEVRKGTDAYSLKYILCVAVERSEQEEYTKAYDWISANDEKFARAWLDGYEVEEEPKYIVSDNSSVPLLIKTDNEKVMSYDSQIAYNNSNGTIELTEQEIKDYDERYWAFAKPVEELEE